MKETTTFTYMRCESCAARTNCETCGHDIEQMLLKLDGVNEAACNIPNKTLTFDASPAAFDDVEDALEGIGVFL